MTITMTIYDFTMKLNRTLTPEDVDALYEAGCSDAAVETSALGALLDFSREAPSLADALLSAIRDIEKVKNLRAVGVTCDNIVSLADIAERAGVTREAARLWSTGQRRPGDFPAPVVMTRGGEKGWDWLQVQRWLADRKPAVISEEGWALHAEIRVMNVANSVLVAREALLSEPDEAVREEFERLLEDA